MRIGVPKEIKDHEFRVGLTPSSVSELTARNHTVLIEQGAGSEAGFLDEAYRGAGAKIVSHGAEIFANSDLIVKVKEPQPEEYHQLLPGQILIAFLHLAPDLRQTEGLLASGCVAFAYETALDEKGRLPLLAPMSEIAGCLAVQAGAYFLLKKQGGRGVLLSKISNVAPAEVVILGGGVVGTAAIQSAVGIGAAVTVLDKSLPRLHELEAKFPGKLVVRAANPANIQEAVKAADVVIGAVLVPGGAAPKLISRAVVAEMKKGSVIVDVAIDQGGCAETSHSTSYSHPTFVEEGVVHYCVMNMPAGVPQTASIALNKATLPVILELADKGAERAALENPLIRSALNIYQGQVTHAAVAEAVKMPFLSVETLLSP